MPQSRNVQAKIITIELLLLIPSLIKICTLRLNNTTNLRGIILIITILLLEELRMYLNFLLLELMALQLRIQMDRIIIAE